MNETWIALIAAFVAISTPLATVLASNWSKRVDREEDRKDRREVHRQLRQVHTLVNNNLTAAIVEAYDAKVSALAGLKEIVEMKKAMGQEISEESLIIIATTEKKVGELATQIVERRRAEVAVEKDLRHN